MLETFFEAITVVFFFIGICIYLHFLAYAISWGWQKGKAKVSTTNNYILNKELVELLTRK